MANGWVVCAVCQRVIWEADAEEREGKLFCVFCDPGESKSGPTRKPKAAEFPAVDAMLEEIEADKGDAE